MDKSLQVVSKDEAKELAEILHVTHTSGDVPSVEEMRRALTLMRDMGLTISETSFFTFRSTRTGKVEVTVAPKAQAVFGKAMPTLRAQGVLEVAGGLVVLVGDSKVPETIEDEMTPHKVVGAWAGLRMASAPGFVTAKRQYSLDELRASTIGDATKKMPNHMLVLRARLWRARELVPDAIGNIYAREEFVESETVDGHSQVIEGEKPQKPAPVESLDDKLAKFGKTMLPVKGQGLMKLEDYVNSAKRWGNILAKSLDDSATGEACREYATAFISRHGLGPIVAMEGGKEMLVTFAGEHDTPLARVIIKSFDTDSGEPRIEVFEKMRFENDAIGNEGLSEVSGVMVAMFKHPVAMANSFKKHGVSNASTWGQIKAYYLFKRLQSIDPLPDYDPTTDSNVAAMSALGKVPPTPLMARAANLRSELKPEDNQYLNTAILLSMDSGYEGDQ